MSHVYQPNTNVKNQGQRRGALEEIDAVRHPHPTFSTSQSFISSLSLCPHSKKLTLTSQN